MPTAAVAGRFIAWVFAALLVAILIRAIVGSSVGISGLDVAIAIGIATVIEGGWLARGGKSRS